jgi:carbamoyltransferase
VFEWATTSAWKGKNNSLKPLWEIDFPHSLGLLYSSFTYYCGFKVNSGEYKLMGLAPYGDPKYASIIRENLLDLKKDGTYRLDMKYFDYAVGLKMTNNKFAELFGGPPREPESPITQREMDLAASIQLVIEDAVLKLAKEVKRDANTDNLCLAGGVALNCVANGKLLQENIFKDIWIQPAAGDAGGALGAAYSVWHEYLDKPRKLSKPDKMKGSYLGPQYSDKKIIEQLDSVGAVYERIDTDNIYSKVAERLNQENIIGWFQGRMEFGPRALGGRSILGDPRSKNMQSTMNLKIKYRESFRPFAPSV